MPPMTSLTVEVSSFSVRSILSAPTSAPAARSGSSETCAFTVPVMWAFLPQDELVGPNLNIALDGAIDSHRIARKRCRLGRAAQGNRLAYRIETVGGAVGIEHDMLAGNGHAAINRSLGNVDGARRKTNGAAHRAVADGESIARGDDIAVDGLYRPS